MAYSTGQALSGFGVCVSPIGTAFHSMCSCQRYATGPLHVLPYVGRYTHRVAISNDRLLQMEDGQVRFRWKEYRDGNQQKTMTLPAAEFLRRFLLHVLPDRFQRIRYYGLLGNRYREQKLARCQIGRAHV